VETDYLFICLGPDHWHKLYAIANRNHQSHIKPKEVKKKMYLWIVNVGHSFHLDFEDKDNQSD
uniref:Uncharacterized protein n=1 Tax=Amazona collaria TaxID=241587 RepID=A0A8B9F8G1_9PSIT